MQSSCHEITHLCKMRRELIARWRLMKDTLVKINIEFKKWINEVSNSVFIQKYKAFPKGKIL